MTGLSSDWPSAGLSPWGRENIELKEEESFDNMVRCTYKEWGKLPLRDEKKQTHIEQSIFHHYDATSIRKVVVLVAGDL